MRIRNILLGALLVLLGSLQSATAAEHWFEEVKATATPPQMYQFLYSLPKGGDLHNHLTGETWKKSIHPDNAAYNWHDEPDVSRDKSGNRETVLALDVLRGF